MATIFKACAIINKVELMNQLLFCYKGNNATQSTLMDPMKQLSIQNIDFLLV